MDRAWALSLMFHGVLLAWLLLFSPVRIYDPTAPATRVSSGRASKMAGQLRERQAEPLSQSLRELEQIRMQMADLEREKREEFLEFASKTAAQASAEAQSLQLAISGAQKEMIASLESSLPELDRFVAMRANANFDRMFHSHEGVRERHVRVVALQEQASGVLSLGGENYADAATAQKAAIDAQGRMSDAMAALDEARDTARGSRERSPMEREYDHYTYHLVRAQARIADGPRAIQDIDAEIAGVDAMAQRLQGEIAKTNDSGKAKLEEQMRIVNEERETLQKKKDRAVKDLEGAQKELPKLSQKAAGIEANLSQSLPSATEADAKVKELHVAATKLQKEALALQEAAGEALAKIGNKEPAVDPGTEALAALGADSTPPVSQGEISEQDLPGIYRKAVSAEEAIVQAYRRHRAMELSMIRRIPLARSLEMTNAAKSARPELAEALGAPVASGDGLKDARDGIQRARGEISSMLHAGRAMLSQARGSSTAEGVSVSFDDGGFSHEQWERLQALAAEDDLAQAKDLTNAMGGGGGFGLNRDGGNGGSAGPGSGDGGPGSGSGSFLPGGPGGPPALGVSGEGKSVPALPGRRIASHGESLPWVFADSWYILGPFDNPRRLNIDTKFPPETVVDLNATYPGKNDVVIGWEYFQSGTPNVMPPFRGYNQARKVDGLSAEMSYRYNLQYAIYYAYTEIRMEQDADLWVAIGSDDHSKVWINDQLVWASGKGAKAWSPDEGYRKVHFRAGINRVLYRIENGNDRTEFSLMVGMNP